MTPGRKAKPRSSAPFDDLVRVVRGRMSKRLVDVPLSVVRDFVRLVFDATEARILETGRFDVPGFGVFRVKHRKARRILDFSGNERQIPQTRSIGFRAAKGVL